ncbi:MAG: beta-ketoacyl-[acyl-carrier-protein] synthase family protein [Bacteroidetes bacterium]|nr:beta-ketoacyl-[acyl-carrier-protein] synthase family protein [Bacteroidota bacterium]
MGNRVVITGYGIISSIGINAAEVLQSLTEGISGIGGITRFKTIHKGKLPLAEVKKSDEELLELFGLTGKKKNYTRTSLLGIAAASQAVLMAGIKPGQKHRTGFISANTVGGMDRTEDFYPLFLENPSKGKLSGVINHDCGDSTDKIAGFLEIDDFITTISTACSSSANAIMLGAEMIKAGMLDRVVAGGTDAVTRFTLNGFNTLMILDKEGCRPFDENRAGLTIGEGSAFLVLEAEETALKEGKTIAGLLSGYGNANDAYHQTASSPDGIGAGLAMAKAIEMSGVVPGNISYINAHGTGTQNNDLSEGIAIQRLFGDNVPPFSSTKPYTGHTLGAAAAIEAVISLLSISHNCIFPNLRWITPMKELFIRPVACLQRDAGVEHVLSNSFGFGGNNSSLLFSKYKPL